MYQFRQIAEIGDLKPMKSAFMAQATSAIDGMWLCGFVPVATHYGIYASASLVGYCCINDEGYLLQYYLAEPLRDDGVALFQQLVSNQSSIPCVIAGVFTSTAEPQMLSYCFESFSSFEVDSIMYRHCAEFTESSASDAFEMVLLQPSQLDAAIDFAHRNTGGPIEWLKDYFGNLIDRKELFGYWVDGYLLATGECRGYEDYQTDYADLGVIVGEAYRQQGIATQVLRFLKAQAYSRSLVPICSTEKSNVASQKAISRSGFIASHRIIRFFSQSNYLIRIR